MSESLQHVKTENDPNHIPFPSQHISTNHAASSFLQIFNFFFDICLRVNPLFCSSDSLLCLCGMSLHSSLHVYDVVLLQFIHPSHLVHTHTHNYLILTGEYTEKQNPTLGFSQQSCLIISLVTVSYSNSLLECERLREVLLLNNNLRLSNCEEIC